VIRFYEPEMDHKIRDQRLLQQDMRVALSRNEFSLCYQPQATVEGEVTGFEALVRWHHRERGLSNRHARDGLDGRLSASDSEEKRQHAA